MSASGLVADAVWKEIESTGSGPLSVSLFSLADLNFDVYIYKLRILIFFFFFCF